MDRKVQIDSDADGVTVKITRPRSEPRRYVLTEASAERLDRALGWGGNDQFKVYTVFTWGHRLSVTYFEEV